MKAVLLAAGLGTRLRPVTDAVPKCLVEVAGRTLLDTWLDALAAAGVDEVLVNTHHLAEQVAAHVAGRTAGPLVHLAHEPVLLGSAGTLVRNREFLDGEDMFLVLNADNLTDFDLRVLVDAHRAGGDPEGAAGGAVATLTVFRTPRPSECGIVEVVDGRVVGFVEKPAVPRSDLANAGMYAFGPEVLEEVPEPLPRDVGFDLLPRLVGRARAVSIGDSWFLDIGTPQALERARAEWGARASA
ncbi:NDP-sugar synthase [Pedococcus sp. NPDC057267]|uniref:nucleotidyltransferase family protein n=1 Tax=Pedococcus sp. NPDC057267 TaxID=3346077 RepID=UPI0036392EFD